MQDIFSATHVHLTGIKGVAMTSIAQCLVDMGKSITGSDVSEDFVTKEILASLPIQVSEFSSTPTLNPSTNLLIYTSAHGGPQNPEVLQAQSQEIEVISQAEAIAQLFNSKKGIAVCGVGGKSTTSAMITWILEQSNLTPSFSVGVGKISGMDRTGRWNAQSEFFIAEADEYVIDPRAEVPVPRFSFLHPQTIVCTNIKYDHPDVYKSFEDTQKAYLQFFQNLKQNGKLIMNGDDQELTKLANQLKTARPDVQIITYGQNNNNNFVINNYRVASGKTYSEISIADTVRTDLQLKNSTINIELLVPGIFNHFNATSAIIATSKVNVLTSKSTQTLSTFKSTKRRFEYIGEKNGVKYYDDYAHHPNEIKLTIQALAELYPANRKVIVFQPHTYSRTKQLFTDFVDSFSQTKEVLLLDIFSSAREFADDSISSQILLEAITKKYPEITITLLKTIDQLAKFAREQLQPEDVMITIGAGDIYTVHDKI